MMKRDRREATTITFSSWFDEWRTELDQLVTVVYPGRGRRVFQSWLEMGGWKVVPSPVMSSDPVYRADLLLWPAHPGNLVLPDALLSWKWFFPPNFCCDLLLSLSVFLDVLYQNFHFALHYLVVLVYGVSFHCGMKVWKNWICKTQKMRK